MYILIAKLTTTSIFKMLKNHCSFIIICSFLLPIFPPFSCSISFNITDFAPDAENITCDGYAKAFNGSLELTPQSKAGEQFTTNRASYADPVRLWDRSSASTANFTTTFSFTINANPDKLSRISDGFVFFLAPVDYPIQPNSHGGFFGLFNDSTNLMRPVVTVEFDSYVNHGLDPNTTHVGINVGTIVSRNYTPWDVIPTLGKLGNVVISYNGESERLDVFWKYENEVAGNSCSIRIDFRKILPELVRIGFSATTGARTQQNSILSWQFRSSLNSRVVTENRGKKQRSTATILIVVGVIGLSFSLIGFGVCYFVVKRIRVKNTSTENTSIGFERGTMPIRFSYQELVAATNNFADNMRLGQGGSGQVYKGILQDLGCLVGVKRILTTRSVDSEKIFINEAKIISRLIHRNLVQFIGWCHENGNFLLVYEYMHNGSLDTHLFCNRKPLTLPWKLRYKIAFGLASAIHYLHEQVDPFVLHRDIKPENVLLDSDFNAKLADFGVAKFVDHGLMTAQITNLVGTFGYLAPEYASEGRATKESDIFSFGIVALELACGRRSYLDGDLPISLAKWVWNLFLAGNVVNAADEGLGLAFDKEEMERLLMVGLWCTNPKNEGRPKVEEVIKALLFEGFMPKFPNDMHDVSPYALTQSSIQDLQYVSMPVPEHMASCLLDGSCR